MDAVSARSTALTPACCPDLLERNGCAGERRSVARLLGELGGSGVKWHCSSILLATMLDWGGKYCRIKGNVGQDRNGDSVALFDSFAVCSKTGQW